MGYPAAWAPADSRSRRRRSQAAGRARPATPAQRHLTGILRPEELSIRNHGNRRHVRQHCCILILVSTVIAVALIASISTLAAAGVGGYITFLTSRTHSATELAIAKNNRIDQQLKERRQIRRDAYVQFLNQANTVQEGLDNYWQAILSEDLSHVTNDLKAVTTELDCLRRLGNLVALEGPDDVTDSALKLEKQLTLECDIIGQFIRRAEGINLHGVDAPMHIDFMKYMHFKNNSRDAKSKMIKVAQKALNDSPHESAPSIIDT
jgi:hypothetical protein